MGTAIETLGMALIVEDDPERRSLAAALAEEVFPRVVEASSAEDALRLLHACPDEVVFAFVNLKDPARSADLARALAARAPGLAVAGAEAGLPLDAIPMPRPWRALDLLLAAERAAAPGPWLGIDPSSMTKPRNARLEGRVR